MLTHIDKEIFINAYQIFKEDVLENSRDFLDFLKSESDIKVYGKPDLELNNILSGFLAGRGDAKIVVHPNRFNKEEVNRSNPYQLVFIDVEDEIQREQFKNEIHYLIGFKDNYETVFEEFKSEPYYEVDKDGDSDPNSSVEIFKSWEQILPDLPITDIIISDPYIIWGDYKYPLKENLFKLLSAIKSKYKVINSLLIYTTVEKISELSKIREEAMKILGQKTIVGTVLFQGKGEHDRHIFTNYKHINLGSSAKYFDGEGNIALDKTSSIRTFSYHQKKEQQIASKKLVDLNKTLKGLQSEGKIPAIVKSRLLDYEEKINLSPSASKIHSNTQD